MKTITEITRWIEGATIEFDDPSEPISQVFCRWIEPLAMYHGEELACGVIDGEIKLRLGPAAYIPIDIETGAQGTMSKEGMPRYGAHSITAGIWALSPSLYIPGLIHTFLTLYDVPIEPPWETRIAHVAKLYDFRTRFSARFDL